MSETTSAELPERLRAVLDLAADVTLSEGQRLRAAWDRMGLNETRYYQTLNAAIDHPAALPYTPMTVNRLRRLRAFRQIRRRTVLAGGRWRL